MASLDGLWRHRKKLFPNVLDSTGYYTTAICIFALVITIYPSNVESQQVWSRWRRQLPPNEWNPWRSPIERFDKFVFSKKLNAYGEFVKGFSIPMYYDDTIWDPNWAEYPQWFLRRINCYLGVPYALAPLGPRRFQVGYSWWRFTQLIVICVFVFQVLFLQIKG